jgi:hypothetical protein
MNKLTTKCVVIGFNRFVRKIMRTNGNARKGLCLFSMLSRLGLGLCLYPKNFFNFFLFSFFSKVKDTMLSRLGLRLCLYPKNFYNFKKKIPKVNGIVGFASLNLFSQGIICFGDLSLAHYYLYHPDSLK